MRLSLALRRSVGHFIEELDRVSAKYWATCKIGSKSKPTEARKKKKQKKKGNKGRMTASDNRRKRACVIFRSLGGTPLENDYELEIYGILQLQSIDEESLSLIRSPQKGTNLVRVIYCIPTVFLEKLLS